jgi:uncharacterized protein Usg
MAANALILNRLFSKSACNQASRDWKLALRFQEDAMVSPDFRKQIEGYGLTTAHILYRLPDYKNILQTYVWQQYDLSPDFPSLQKFLTFWTREIEGPLHSVRIAHHRLIQAREIRAASLLHLH